MATKQRPPFGLLAKVVNYFRESPDAPDDQNDSQQSSTQETRSGDTEMRALSERIGRKRQDDLIRRREFDHLRMLRKQPLASGLLPPPTKSPGTGFQHSSGFGVTDAASTIRKIDAIEAHMVNAWGKSKLAAAVPAGKTATTRPAPSAPAAAPTPTAATAATPPKSPATAKPTAPAAPSSPVPSAPSAPPPADDLDLDFMHLAAASVTPGTAAPPPTVTTEEHEAGPLESGLQNAAIYFAEGDSASAEAVLLDLLQGESVTARDADALAFALFDLYRSTGQQDGFDVVAMDYAERFGHSPAEWYSVPEKLRNATDTPPEPAAPVGPVAVAPDNVWVCPATLDEAALTALKARFATATAWSIAWDPLRMIVPEVKASFAALIDTWSKSAVQLHWSGIEALLHAMSLHTPADDPSGDPQWWLMRMDVLCILGQQEAFESLALDYCVVYEVSPPSWKQVKCQFDENASGKRLTPDATLPDTADAPSDDTADDEGQAARCALSGSLTGDAEDAMAQLHAAARGRTHLLVSCALLLRVDFSVAGALLNWAASCEAEGCDVHFVQVPRLVAVFFQMLGLDRHAKISVRTH